MDLIKRYGGWVIVILAVAAILLWPRFATREKVIPLPCTDIVAGCPLPAPGAQIRFDRQPDALQKFRISVQWPGAAEVHASFQMQDMEMGFNRYRLLPAAAEGWQAEVMLPACIQGRKDWLVILEIGGRKYALPFTSR